MQQLRIIKNSRDETLKRINYIDSWSEIIEVSPIDLSRVHTYAQAFISNTSVPIMPHTIDYAKRKLFDARNNLDLMITTLVQILYDNEVLAKSEDRVLFGWLKDDLGRFMQALDNSENIKIVTFDDPREKLSKVGIARIAVYTKEMNNAYKSIYEALLKAMKEFYNFKETEDIKREKRTFLYILFHVFSLTMSVLGSMTRQPNSQMGKRGIIGSVPTTWQTMMSDSGRREIRESYKRETGIDLPEDFIDPEVQAGDNIPDEDSFGGSMDDGYS